MAEFLAELRRRHIFRIGGIYVVVAWGIAQVIDFLSQVFALPDWVAQPVAIVLAIGLPVVLIASWLIVGAAKSVDTPAELKKATATDWALIGAFALVIGLIGYQRFVPASTESIEMSIQQNNTQSIVGEIVGEVVDRLPNSVAVLPFENVSPNPDDEYFAVGLHDELIGRLSRLSNLTVIARASVMKYENYQESGLSIPEIAQELNVEMIMAGSVRLAGDQVRVNAELIDGKTSVPVWSQPYDGDRTDIFGIQAEIAMNIANSLQAGFSDREREGIEAATTNDSEAYDLFLRAIALIRSDIVGADSGDARRLVISILDDALEIDPELAMANVYKALVYRLSKLFDPIPEGDWLQRRAELDALALDAVERALSVDPNLAPAHAELAELHMENGRPDDAQAEVQEALRLSPNDPDVMWTASSISLLIGDDPGAASQYLERVRILDPNNSGVYDNLGRALKFAGRYGEAVEVFRRCLEINALDTGCSRQLAAAYVGVGDRDSALDELNRLEIRYGRGRGPGTWAAMIHGFGVLNQPDRAQAAFDILEEVAEDRYVDPVIWAQAYMGIGQYDEAYRLLNVALESPGLIQVPFQPFNVRHNHWSDPVLEEPEWIQMRNRLANIYN